MAETGLRAGPDFVTASLAGLPVIVWALDGDGVITLAEGRAPSHLDLEPAQLVGQSVFELYAAEPAVLEPIVAALAGQEVHRVVEVGGVAWENRYFPRREGDTVTGLVCISMDMTLHRNAQAAQAQTARLWRAVVENARVRIVLIDHEHRFLFVNYFGPHLKPDQVVGQSIYDYFHVGEHEEARACFEQVFGGGPPTTFESSTTATSGTVRWFSNRVAPVSKDGVVESVIIVATDITERIEAAEEHARLQQQMRHAQKLESLGVLAGGIAHDFNNLLASVLGHAELARAALAPEHPVVQDLDDIVGACGAAAELCRQMLAYAGKGRFELGAVHLSKVVGDLSKLLSVSLGRGTSLVRQLEPNLWPIEADSGQVQQVVMNLITNAAEAVADVPNGKVTVTTGQGTYSAAELSQHDLLGSLSSGDYVFLEVADTGHGMSEETRTRMFDPFFTTKVAGRGLGMASVLGIMRGHRGSLSVVSYPGEGTTIRVLFPRSNATTRVGGSRRPAVYSPVDFNGRSVLVVDDEPRVRRAVTLMLERIGMEVSQARDGLEAVESYQRSPTDLVLMDVTMPRMNGLDAARALVDRDANVRVVLCSGYLDHEPDALPACVRGTLAKPYLAEALYEQIAHALSG